jgi:hypothetical protein
MSLPQDLIDLLVEFDAEGVEYLLVGGHAVAIHGHPRFTKDADVWLRDTPGNIAGACRALHRFGAPQPVLEALPRAAPEDVVWMGRPPTRIDLMKGVPGGNFDHVYARRMVLDVHGLAVSVVGLQDLIALKEASGRARDLEDVKALRLAADIGDGTTGD